MTRVLVPLADGCEEMEAVIIIDVLRRAGWEVVAAGMTGSPIVCSRGVRLVPDADWDDVDPASFDLLVIPGGGPGTKRLQGDDRVLQTIRSFHSGGKIVAAVCAGPLVLQEAGVLDGRDATCHPAVAGQLTRARRRDEPVVWAGRIATSQGPGTCVAFALDLVRHAEGADAAARLANDMVLQPPPRKT